MKVLVIKTSSMGDILHTLPALTDAARALPGIGFDWLVEEAFAEIPGWHPAVDQVIPVAIRRWRKTPLKTLTGPEWQAFRQRLKSTRYDLAIDAQGLLKSALLSRFIDCPVCGYDRRSVREPLASAFYDKRFSVSKRLHAVERIRQLFAAALNYPLPNSAGDAGLPRSRFTTAAASRPYVVLLHGTTRDDKHWPEPYWQALCRQLGEAGVSVRIPWHGEKERQRAEKIAACSPMAEVLPALSLQGIATELAGSCAFVAVDTGLGHLGSALGVPGVSLYGPTSPALIGAYGEGQVHLLASDMPAVKVDPGITPAVMQPLLPEQVLAALQNQGLVLQGITGAKGSPA